MNNTISSSTIHDSAFCLVWKPEIWAWESFSDDQQRLLSGGVLERTWSVMVCESLLDSSSFIGRQVYIFRLGWEPRDLLSSGLVAQGIIKAVASEKTSLHSADINSKNELCLTVELSQILDPTKDLFVSTEVIQEAGLAGCCQKLQDGAKCYSSLEEGGNVRRGALEHGLSPYGLSLDVVSSSVISDLWQACSPRLVRTLLPQAFPISQRLEDSEQLWRKVQTPRNRIFFGPPGTGKTHEMLLLRKRYEKPTCDTQDFTLDEDSTPMGKRCYEMVVFHAGYTYEDFVEGMRPVMSELGHDGPLRYEIKDGVLKRLCLEARKNPRQRFALFIDEINRADVASVFGEILTLAEIDKRVTYDPLGRCQEGVEVTLPYSGKPFGIPKNVDLYATMNGVDRSLTGLDKAFRRRFNFQWMPVVENVLPGCDHQGNIYDELGREIQVRQVLKGLNQRISEYLSDNDVFGQGYFMRVTTWQELVTVLMEQVIPQLQELIFDDITTLQAIFRDVDANHVVSKPQWISSKGYLGCSASEVSYDMVIKLYPEKNRSSHSPYQDAFQSSEE